MTLAKIAKARTLYLTLKAEEIALRKALTEQHYADPQNVLSEDECYTSPAYTAVTARWDAALSESGIFDLIKRRDAAQTAMIEAWVAYDRHPAIVRTLLRNPDFRPLDRHRWDVTDLVINMPVKYIASIGG